MRQRVGQLPAPTGSQEPEMSLGGVLGRIIKLVLMLFGLFVAFELLLRLFRRLCPFPVPPTLTRLFSSPVREASQSRQVTISRMGLRPGMRVLEVGAGVGRFTVDAARAVGADGRLDSIDIEPEMVAGVRERVQQAGLQNVEARVADVRHLPFPSATFDVVYLVAVLGSIIDKGRALREARRVLKPSGRLSITEGMSDADYLLMDEVVGWAQMVGFELVEEHGNAFLYTLNFRSLLGP